jgi:hypothetical protein
MDTLENTTAAPPVEEGSRKGRVAAVLGAVVVLAGGGLIVVRNLQSAAGGFDSPEAAVSALFQAADQEDLLGVVDALRPGERAMLRDTLMPLEKEMERLDVLDKNVDMHQVAGVQITVDGLTSRTEALDDHLAVVTLTGGTISTNADVADLPLGPVLRDGTTASGTSSGPSQPLDGTKIATVNEDGRWYVSFGYSIAEAARVSADQPLPDFAHPIPTPGADSPEGAVQALADAAASLDLASVIGALAPGEFGPMQEYATLFVPDAQASIDQWKAEHPVKATITLGDPTVHRDGATATVAFETGTILAEWDANSFTVAVDASRCTTVTAVIDGTTTTQHQCVGDQQAGSGDVPPEVQTILHRLSDVSLRATVVQEHGRWYVAPVRSMFDMVRQVLQDFTSADDAATIRDWIGSLVSDGTATAAS